MNTTENYDYRLFENFEQSGIRALDARTYHHSPLVLAIGAVALTALLIGGVLCN